MRRKDREMNKDFAFSVLDKAPFVTLSMVNEDKPYSVPVSIARDNNILYFHCALEGSKVDILNKNNNVTLTAVSKCKPRPIDFTLEYESAVVNGKAFSVIDEKEKIYALKLICEKYALSNIDNFENAINRSLHRTNIIKIEIDDIYGKRKKYGSDGKELKYCKEK
ncbi:pyridoxamine 5'-phosphate oxidase family protein [Anaerofustis stercorihominis]|uniref:pyridoxamine 5'-phosphate oxidase family protein n=1 Tax=Anaerofustis stercorihominis TaxID=214853 RepID=UPI00214BA01F|nr:pyridoxamine 5'-phosphate oxidase family protein [Anaerofustis stercorihominis]MCR2032692.1 pyridoxamine 5'-phosphate oxidase family protein [Anaerofustis stercorihominis]